MASIIAMFHRSFCFDSLLPWVTHQALYWTCTNSLFLFFSCIHSYHFIVLIEILPFSQMFDICLPVSSLLSPCLRTLTIFHWHRRSGHWRRDLLWIWILSLCSKLTFRVSYGSQSPGTGPILWPTTRCFRQECFYHFFQRTNCTVHLDIEMRCKIRNLNSYQPLRQTSPEEPLCVECCFRNLRASNMQRRTQGWTKISRQRIAKTKDMPFVGMMERSSGNRWPFRHVSPQRHPCATELAVVTTPATSIAVTVAGGIGTCWNRCGAIPYHSALSYSCQVSSIWRGLRGANSFQLLSLPHSQYHEIWHLYHSALSVKLDVTKTTFYPT